MGCRWSRVRISPPRLTRTSHSLPVKRLYFVLQCLVASSALAQGYPAHPVKIVVPFAAGGVADITARVLSQKMGESMRQQVIVENRPSAGGIVASEAVARAEPDGYTLLFITNGNAVSASLFKFLPYDTVNDFEPISTVGFFDLVLIVDSISKIGSVRELIAAARASPNKLNIGTINIGSTQNLAAELFKSMSGIDAQVVPFKATPAVITALKGGDVQAAFEILAPVMAQIDRLNREVNAATGSPEVRKRLQDLGVEARGGTPEALRDLLVSEIAKWKAVIERAKIEKQ